MTDCLYDFKYYQEPKAPGFFLPPVGVGQGRFTERTQRMDRRLNRDETDY